MPTLVPSEVTLAMSPSSFVRVSKSTLDKLFITTPFTSNVCFVLLESASMLLVNVFVEKSSRVMNTLDNPMMLFEMFELTCVREIKKLFERPKRLFESERPKLFDSVDRLVVKVVFRFKRLLERPKTLFDSVELKLFESPKRLVESERPKLFDSVDRLVVKVVFRFKRLLERPNTLFDNVELKLFERVDRLVESP